MKNYHDTMVSVIAGAVILLTVGASLMSIDALKSSTRMEIAQAQAAYEAEQTEAQKLGAKVDELSARALLPEGMEAEYIGSFFCTAYCCEEYPHICGGNGVTATGTKPTPGITAAADWDVLPAGSVVYIEGVGIRVIEDSGSAVRGNDLDIAVQTHAEALSWAGYGEHRVWRIEGGE